MCVPVYVCTCVGLCVWVLYHEVVPGHVLRGYGLQSLRREKTPKDSAYLVVCVRVYVRACMCTSVCVYVCVCACDRQTEQIGRWTSGRGYDRRRGGFVLFGVPGSGSGRLTAPGPAPWPPGPSRPGGGWVSFVSPVSLAISITSTTSVTKSISIISITAGSILVRMADGVGDREGRRH